MTPISQLNLQIFSLLRESQELSAADILAEQERMINELLKGNIAEYRKGRNVPYIRIDSNFEKV